MHRGHDNGHAATVHGLPHVPYGICSTCFLYTHLVLDMPLVFPGQLEHPLAMQSVPAHTCSRTTPHGRMPHARLAHGLPLRALRHAQGLR